MNNMNAKNESLDAIFSELSELDESPKGKVYPAAPTRWEDRTTLDRLADFIQTTESSDLMRLAGLALIVVGLLALPVFF